MNDEGWDISLNIDEKCIDLSYTDENGKTQLWPYSPRQALVLAQFLIEKSNTLLDMRVGYDEKY